MRVVQFGKNWPRAASLQNAQTRLTEEQLVDEMIHLKNIVAAVSGDVLSVERMLLV